MTTTDSPAPTVAWGEGLATETLDGRVLDTWYPDPRLGPLPAGRDRHLVPASLADLASTDERREVRIRPVVTTSALTEPVASVSDAYLRLHLLSRLLVAPNTINLDGIYAHLPNNAWTNAGPVALEASVRLRARLRAAGIAIVSVDKFPRLLDYVTPDRVRIADGSRVRLGAYLAPGTVVMHEGFVNINAGTLGASMVEGRISQGVVVGNGSDIGGGASIMGTHSGSGTRRITIGERALLGANSGLGISLGDDSIIEAGLYVTAGTKVALVGVANPAGELGEPRIVKAIELSGVSKLLFRRNSVTGAVEAVARPGSGIELSAALDTAKTDEPRDEQSTAANRFGQ